ncbi:MAG: Sec-independent protein translocase subunit TatA [Luminiphilus sp.]|jgi:sec-independent protein translocase protein TatA|nr:Sec-independent protein translocase subunit TatA [Luminiphilus sp.]MDA0630786.1 Sec-independent protein translocase subunit TatA [Pseudomonadota bacterium]
MGLGGISIWQLLIILAIVVMLFGTSRLKNIGSDLGSAIKGFKKSIKENDGPDDAPQERSADTDADSQK